MKRNVLRILVPILVLAMLAGCTGKLEVKPTPTPADLRPNPDGTLGNLRWGMTWEEAGRADGRIVFPEDAAPKGKDNKLDERPDVLIQGVDFLGHTADLELAFEYFGEEKQPRLTMLRVLLFLKDGEPDYIPLVGECIDAANRDVGEWTSPETLGETVSREALKEFYPDWAEEDLDTIAARPLWFAFVQSLNGPSDVYGFETVTTGDREFTYFAAGYSQVQAQVMAGSI